MSIRKRSDDTFVQSKRHKQVCNLKKIIYDLNDDILQIIFSYIEFVKFSNSYEYNSIVANGAILSQKMFNCITPNFELMFLNKNYYKNISEIIRRKIIDKLKTVYYHAYNNIPIMYYIHQSFLGENMSHIQLIRVLSKNRCICCSKSEKQKYNTRKK